MTEDESNSESLMERQTTGEDRVRMVARQLSEPQTANWIASEAGWSHEPTKRVLERLVDDGILIVTKAALTPHITLITGVRRCRRRCVFETAGTLSRSSRTVSRI
jgi:hypothetical protein